MISPRYKRLKIEWKHFAVGEATGERCGSTGATIHEVIEELWHECVPAEVTSQDILRFPQQPQCQRPRKNVSG